MDYKFTNPLEWPVTFPRTEQPEHARFHRKSDKGYGGRSLSIAEACDELMHQIRLFSKGTLDVDLVIISTNLKPRLDGRPRSGQKQPDDVGVAVYFEIDGNPSVIPCDRFNRIADNIYALAMVIDSMRRIDRYGAPAILRAAFTGFKGIPEKASDPGAFLVLGIDREGATDSSIKQAFRIKVKALRPDLDDSDTEAYQRLVTAKETALVYIATHEAQ